MSQSPLHQQAVACSEKRKDFLSSNNNHDSLIRTRTVLTEKFKLLREFLIGRQSMYGRCIIAGSESDSLKGDGKSFVDGHPQPDALALARQTEHRDFIAALSQVLGRQLGKLNADFLTRPFLSQYDLQTSKELQKHDKCSEFAETLGPRWAGRCVDNIKGVTFGILDCIYSIYDEVMEADFFYRFIVEWTLIYLQGRFAKLWKLQTTLYFCVATKQPEPPEYDPDELVPFRPAYLSGGRFFKYLRKKMKPTDYRRRVPFFYSLMQTKRNTVSLSWKEEKKALEKHRLNMQGAAFKGTGARFETVSKINPETWEVEEEQIPIIGSSNDNVTKAVDKISSVLDRSFGKNSRKRFFRHRPPAINSTYSHSRARCGAQGWFSDLLCYDLRPVLVGYIEEGWKPVPVMAPRCLVMGDIDDLELYLKVQDYWYQGYPLINTHAQIHTVLEPLKARIITSGDAPTYHWARMVQKTVHGALRKDRYMELMGRPHEASYFQEKFHGKILPKGWFWVAGDYDAATDGMNPRLSLEFCRKVGEKLKMTVNEIKRYQSTMCGHTIHYPKWTGLEEIEQIWGQLMGSPSSFPALCVANLVGFWVACEEYAGESLEYEDLESFCVQINGDDICFIANQELYSIWKRVMSDIGLTPSIGKNFQADNWFMINSTCYWVEYYETVTEADIDACQTDEDLEILAKVNGYLSRGDRIVKKITDMDHIDPGLVAGISKVQSDTRLEEMSELDKDAQLYAMCAKLRKAVDSRSPDISGRMTNCFHYHCGNSLRESKRSWTLPETLGGLGLPGDCNKSTRLQKLVALKVAGSTIFPEFDVHGPDREKILKFIKVAKPQTERGDAPPAYRLPDSIRNDRTKDYKGFPVPDLSHYELSSGRELTDGAIFERCLRDAAKTVDKVNLSWIDDLDFNRLKDFTFTNEESRVSIRTSFNRQIKYDTKAPLALSLAWKSVGIQEEITYSDTFDEDLHIYNSVNFTQKYDFYDNPPIPDTFTYVPPVLPPVAYLIDYDLVFQCEGREEVEAVVW